MKTRKIFRCLLTLMLFFAFAKSGSAETVTYQFNSNGELEVVAGTVPPNVSVTSSGFAKYAPLGIFANYYVEKGKKGDIIFNNFNFSIKDIKVVIKEYGNTQGVIAYNSKDAAWISESGIGDKEFTVYHNNGEWDKLENLASLSISTASYSSNSVHIKSITINYTRPNIEKKSELPSFMTVGETLELTDYLQIDYDGAKYGISDYVNSGNRYSVRYTSSNSEVLKVDSKGKVEALSDGDAKVIVSIVDNNNNKAEVSRYEVPIDVIRFSAKGNLLTYCCHSSSKEDSRYGNDHDLNSIKVNQLTEKGDHYTFSTNREANGGFFKIGTLSSTTSKRYRVGFQNVRMASALPFTKVNTSYQFKIDVSADRNINHGAEIIASQSGTIDSYINSTSELNTSINSTYSTNGICRVTSTSSSKTTSSAAQKSFVIDNSDNSGAKDFYIAVMSFTRHLADNENPRQTANFWYKHLATFVEYYTYVKYNKNDGSNTVSSETTLTSTDKKTEVALPKCSFSTDRQGKVFIGWNTQADGEGEFVKSTITPYNPATGGGRGHITLYAIWYDKSTSKVKFNYTQTIEKKTVEIRDYEYYSSKYNHLNNVESYNNKYTTPVAGPEKEGYIFDGWVDKEQNGEIVYFGDGKAREGNYWVKNADGELVWKSTQSEVNLYPQWIKDATFASVNIIRDNNYEGTNVNHRYVGVAMAGMTSVVGFHGKGYITIDGENYLSTKENGGEDQILSVKLEEAPIWNFVEDDRGYIISTEVEDAQGNTKILYLGMKLLNSNDPSQGYKKNGLGIQTVIPEMRFTIYNEKGWICYGENEKIYNHILYMKDETKAWEYEDTGDNEQYKPIRILAYGAGVGYGNLNSTKVVDAIKKELTNPKYAYNVGTTPSIDDPDLCKGVLYVDMGGAANIIEENSSDLANFKSLTSDNCMFFVPSNYKNKLGNNVVGFDGVDYKSLSDLVIKDKMPFSSPYTFHLGNYTASYTRESANKWSSLFLPFQVKANDNIKFYELYGSDEVRLAYQSIGENAVPANKPIACFGSGTFTLTNTNVEVMKDPVDLSKGPYSEELFAFTSEDIREFAENFGSAKPEAGSEDCEAWQLVGTRFARYIYGTENAGAMPAGSNVEKRNVYYFSGGNFTYVNPKGRVLFAPFRAYYQLGANSSIKTFSIIAFDENDGATDITDVMTGNDSEGDGKIYDLMGRRVKMPLKGHVYVVNGKKKLY